MRIAFFILALLMIALCGQATTQTYDAVVFSSAINATPVDFGGIHFIDTATSRVTTQYTFTERNRGGFIGPDGLAYIGLWDTNGVGALDPATGVFVNTVTGSNAVIGAPYALAPNYDNIGGFGICCIDGNVPPAPAPAATRNTVLVDFAARTAMVDGWFPDTETDQGGFFPNLFKAGTFVGVPRHSSDLSVSEYPLALTPPQALALTTLTSLSVRGYFGTTWAEDGMIYIWGSHFVGIQQVDIRQGTSTIIPVSGVYGPTYSAMWTEPWEKTGMKAFLCGSNGDTFTIDLMARPIVATQVLTIKGLPLFCFPVCGCNVETNQLCSWWSSAAKPAERIFHLNFGPAHAGEICILVPSLTGLRPLPALMNGLEVHLAIDSVSMAGVNGVLPYAPVVTLDSTGQADITWRGLGAKLGLSAYWQAFSLKGSVFTDVSNLIHVTL